METPPDPIKVLADAEAAERKARTDHKAAARNLDNAIRDAVALSFKRKGNGSEPFDVATLMAIGRLSILANLAKANADARRVATQAALLNIPANG